MVEYFHPHRPYEEKVMSMMVLLRVLIFKLMVIMVAFLWKPIPKEWKTSIIHIFHTFLLMKCIYFDHNISHISSDENIQLDARDSGGRTALHLACSEGHYDYTCDWEFVTLDDNCLQCVWFQKCGNGDDGDNAGRDKATRILVKEPVDVNARKAKFIKILITWSSGGWSSCRSTSTSTLQPISILATLLDNSLRYQAINPT